MLEGSAAVVSAKVLIPQVLSLARERVDSLLARIWQYRVGLVVAPAGSGKSTLLAGFASVTDAPVGWYRAESWDAKTATLLTHLHSAFTAALGPIPDGWDSVETAARALETWAGRRALLVIDDLHTLEDSAAELTLERLIDYAPPSITFLMGSRALPGFNLSRLRVSGALLEIGSEDLRFRSWEVERLFRDFYREPLPPEELAELARRTEGWAAGLQLFHLATRGKSPQERRRILTALGTRSRLTREYLTRNVLDQLPAELRWFLVRTCVLTRLSGPICDAFLERTGSQQVLEELERRQIFTYATDDRGGYRYHEVLRSHLEQVLMDELGEIQARAAYSKAAALLERSGAFPEAIQAYSRGEDWEAVDRLLHHQGGELLAGPDTWIDALPPALLRQDPWLMLGSARRHRAEGRWREAIEAYHRAERVFGSSDAGLLCALERKALAGWMEPAPMPGTDWAGLLRKAVAHDPLAAKQQAGQLPEATGKLTIGVICLLAGQLDQARRLLRAAADSRDATAALATAARLWTGVAALLSGDLQGVFDVEESAESAEALGLGWVARLARAALVLAHRPGSTLEADVLRAACERDGDRWGSALVALMTGWAALYDGENANPILEEATDAFHGLGAGVLEAWSRALLSLSLARAGAPEAREAALQAENLARYSGTPGARYFPYGVTLDGQTPQNLYITDSFNHRIRRVDAVGTGSTSTNLIHTVAGDGASAFADGPPAQAHFNRPWSATIDGSNLYVADYLNDRLRRIDLTAQSVSTLAGVGTAGLKGDVGPADAAEVDGPRGLNLLGSSGAMLVADSLNNRVRWLGLTGAGVERTEVDFDPTNLSTQSQPQSVTVSSTGSGLLVMGAVDLVADRDNFYLDPAKNTCAQARLEPGISCSFAVAFQPRAPGSHTGSVVIPNDAVGGPQVVTLKGQATAALVTLSPPAVVINQPINGTAAPAVVTMTNNGNGLLHINSIGLDPGTSPDFSQSNNCPGVMPAHSSCQITITLSPIGPDDTTTRTGTLTVKDDAGGNADSANGGTSQSVPLTGSLAQAAATFSQQSLTFTQNLGTASPAETILLSNSGEVPLHLSGIHDDGDFAQTNNCPPVLAPGANCAISVTFIPTNLGERDGYIVVADDSIDSPQRIEVMGVGTMSLAQLGPERMNFSQNVGATTPPQTATLTNRGDGPLTIGDIAATGDFNATPRCPTVLLPGQSCTVDVSFAPQAAGARHGSLMVTDDANASPGSEQTVRLSGIGYQPVASLSATALSPGANLGASAGPQTVTVTNTGDGALTIRAIRISGAAAGDYTESNNCLRTIQPGGSCAITVNFTPHGYGVRLATLTIADDGLGGTQSIALRGTGTAGRPMLSSGFLNFGGDSVGNPTVPQSVVLFNAGNGPLSIDSISLTSPDYTMTTSCGSTLAAGKSCTISVTFTPQATGVRPGVVTITDAAGTQRISLSGVGT